MTRVDFIAIVIPNKGTTEYILEFGCPEAEPLRNMDGVVIALMPDDGVLKTSFDFKGFIPYDIFQCNLSSLVVEDIDPDSLTSVRSSVKNLTFDIKGDHSECAKSIRFLK